VSDAPAWLWVAFTLVAAFSQTFRNLLQKGLTATLGTVGATHVRFLFGLPCAVLMVGVVLSASPPRQLQWSAEFWLWVWVGGLAQIVATALMLGAMQGKSFAVATAYVKSEPVTVALLAFVFLGEPLGWFAAAAIVVATVGVVLMSMPAPNSGASASAAAPPSAQAAGQRPGSAASGVTSGLGGPGWASAPVVLGIGAGALFALAAVGFRGAVLALGDDPFYVRAAVTLVVSLAIQTGVLSLWLALRSPDTLGAIFRAWRPSLGAGALGAFASLCWFVAFALQSPALVRTLALVEILFAMALARRLFAQRESAREVWGIALMVLGVAALLIVPH
jgi:drug/metabolite transporter (DMT)-like permease